MKHAFWWGGGAIFIAFGLAFFRQFFKVKTDNVRRRDRLRAAQRSAATDLHGTREIT
jgi:hypothetical protein